MLLCSVPTLSSGSFFQSSWELRERNSIAGTTGIERRKSSFALFPVTAQLILIFPQACQHKLAPKNTDQKRNPFWVSKSFKKQQSTDQSIFTTQAKRNTPQPVTGRCVWFIKDPTPHKPRLQSIVVTRQH